MKTKRVILFIVFVTIILILNSTSVLAFRAPIVTEVYNRTSLIISIIMKLIIFIIFISYVVFSIILIKSKKDKNEKIKKLIKWLIIAVIIILILWFGSEAAKKIGMIIKYY